ncbi:MAG: hypothetical protein IJK02_00745, partial [Clostridia bacterium]|nr:hypothetical protein [Clostridia bacterium]
MESEKWKVEMWNAAWCGVDYSKYSPLTDLFYNQARQRFRFSLFTAGGFQRAQGTITGTVIPIYVSQSGNRPLIFPVSQSGNRPLIFPGPYDYHFSITEFRPSDVFLKIKHIDGYTVIYIIKRDSLPIIAFHSRRISASAGDNHGDGYPDLRQSIGEPSPDFPRQS